MSWAAAYSLATSPLSWVDLPNVNRSPGAPRFGAIQDLEERDNRFETDDGTLWVYRSFSRNVWRLTFRVQPAELAVFRAMHDAVDGALNPFYFRIGGVSGDVLYCRKETGFAPRMLSEPTLGPVYDYTITLTEELISEEF